MVPDFRLNKAFEPAQQDLPQARKDKVEFLCNECCWPGCKDRKAAAMRPSAAKTLAKPARSTYVPHPVRRRATAFPKQCRAPAFIGTEEICRSLSAYGLFPFQDRRAEAWAARWCWNFCSTIMTKPEYQLHVREAIYLDNMLDLF